MPVRIPKARASEGFAFATAGVVGFAPFYFMLPSAEARLASQTQKWAPRWERSVSFIASPAERVAQRVEPRVSKNIQKLDNKLPLERMSKAVGRRTQNGFDHLHLHHQ
ncbi:hypothetical protein KJ359_002052 [Pestalotiopsis sp. 9143b]|nr:hypothetical protein KJ359_002052 [Pestalotiopsis sp. 9143b]